MALPQGKGEPVSSEVPQLERMWYVGEVAQLNVLQAMIKSCQPCSLYSLQHNRKNHMLWSILMTFLTFRSWCHTPKALQNTYSAGTGEPRALRVCSPKIHKYNIIKTIGVTLVHNIWFAVLTYRPWQTVTLWPSCPWYQHSEACLCQTCNSSIACKRRHMQPFITIYTVRP